MLNKIYYHHTLDQLTYDGKEKNLWLKVNW